MRRLDHRATAFTLVEILIVVAIIGLLVAIAIPSFVKAREHAQKNSCINNLRMIDAVKQQWALENRKGGTAVPVQSDLQPYLVRGTGGRIPTCPAGGRSAAFSTSYEVNQVTTPPNCLIVPGEHRLPN